ncbi:hypothetical protein OGCDGJMD_00815 [Cyanobium usitatum str. Tous]|nr:hypothetical protein OGCDGJMD_00815 [Cyanobium usitatum str. Tous]
MSMSKQKAAYGWVPIIAVSALFGGYRALTGSSLTRDAGIAISSSQASYEQPVKSRDLTTKRNGSAESKGAVSEVEGRYRFLESSPSAPTNASRLTDLQEQAIGFLAQTICSARRYDYTPEEVKYKVDYFIEAKNAESIREWMTEPKVVGAASTLAMAFNSNCTNYDPESEYAKQGFRLMDNL